MGVAEDIIAARIYGSVRCGSSSQPSPTVPELAREFGLRDEPSCYKEIDELAARHLIQSVLHRDMAYNMEIMPEARAAELADRFLTQFGQGTRYFSNVDGPGCHPVTAATFDTGLLAIGPDRSGCLWVEDED